MPELSPDDPRIQLFGSIGFDKALPGLRLVSIDDDLVTAEITVREEIANMLGTLHGGAIATLLRCSGIR